VIDFTVGWSFGEPQQSFLIKTTAVVDVIWGMLKPLWPGLSVPF